MLLIIRNKADESTLKQVAEDFSRYIKVVVDIKRQILSAGGEKHVDGEQLLLKDGSQQKNLWGGGLDLETGEVDFDSMINLLTFSLLKTYVVVSISTIILWLGRMLEEQSSIRPSQKNPSREVLDQNIRLKMTEIIRNLLR